MKLGSGVSIQASGFCVESTEASSLRFEETRFLRGRDFVMRRGISDEGTVVVSGAEEAKGDRKLIAWVWRLR